MGFEKPDERRGYKHFVPAALNRGTMITTTFKTWIDSAKNSLTNLRALIIFAVLYALLLVTFYIFVSTREATFWQVLVTYLFLLLLPAEFFVLQAAIIARARLQRFPWAQIVRDAIKIAIVTIPIILIAWLFWALLDKFQLWYRAPLAPITFGTPPKPQTIHWPTIIFSTIRLVLFGIALPLAAIHLWFEATARDVRASFAD